MRADVIGRVLSGASAFSSPLDHRFHQTLEPRPEVVGMSRVTMALAIASAIASMAAPAGQGSATYLQKTRTFYSSAEFAAQTGGRLSVERRLDESRLAALRRTITSWPVTDVTVLGPESASELWVGTKRGAIRYTDGYRAHEYFAGLRWLPDDQVTGIAVDGDVAWIETPKGYARIEYRPTTLADKSDAFVRRIQERHVRWGLTADSQLRVAGDLSTNRTRSTDNDGLWTAMYVAAESFRFKVTGDAAARENARRGMQAIVRLEQITGRPGFPARSFIKVGADEQPADGEWHDTPDTAWRWKGDTSSDEIVGHYFVYPIYLDLAADEDEKPALRAVIDRITNHILDNGYQLIDVDGKRTRWGWWAPGLIWEDPDETGLRALHMLSHLRVALSVTADPGNRKKFRAAYDDLIARHRYHLLLRNQKITIPGHINHSDDELAFLSFYPLLRYETVPALLAVYQQALERSWQTERPERNPLWNVIYAAGTRAAEFDREASLRTLREIPMDQIEWSVTNSHRLDVPIDSLADRFKRPQALIVLPYDELPMSKWNGNPFSLDGGNGGRSEDDGAYFLLPYWMGRFHGLWE
jgi:hypothetical protein